MKNLTAIIKIVVLITIGITGFIIGFQFAINLINYAFQGR